MARKRFSVGEVNKPIAGDEQLYAVVEPYRVLQEQWVYRTCVKDLVAMFQQDSEQKRIRALAQAVGTSSHVVRCWLAYEAGLRTRDRRGRLTVINPQSKAFRMGERLYRFSRQHPDMSRCRPIRIVVSGWLQISEDCRNRRIEVMMNGPQAWHFLTQPSYAALSNLYLGSSDAVVWYERPVVSIQML